jgi:dipeptidyl aminopeptidase/acylaminoacyl peptidase
MNTPNRVSLAIWLLALSSMGVAAAASNDSTSLLPLQPTRTIDFTTDEGTWMSVDVSPDGKTVIFDHLGDLFTVPIEGGAATRVTGGMAWDVQPRFSPDGKRILMVSDRDGGQNLWTLALDGSDPRQLTTNP